MKKCYGFFGIVWLWFAGTSGAAAELSFSATMVQEFPNQGEMTSKIHVSGDAMREETTIQGQTRIRIYDKSKSTMYLLNPDKKEYVEITSGKVAGPGGPDQPPLPDEKGSPCQQASSGITCTRLGMETINGRSAEKWRFAATKGQQEAEWTEWFDKELRIPIRGEGPSGMMRELSDIEVGPQPPELFRVPAGYEKIEMPKGQPPGRGGQGGYR